MQIGKMYKIKPQFIKECGNAEYAVVTHVQFYNSEDYYIYRNGERVDWCSCYKPEHLEMKGFFPGGIEIGDRIVIKGNTYYVVDVGERGFVYPLFMDRIYITYEEAQLSGWKIVEKRTSEDVLNDLSEEDREIIEEHYETL